MTPETAFDQHHQAVYSFAYRLTGDQDAAEDITQECFLAFVRAPQRFDPTRGTIKVFLFSIARNLALKEYRDTRSEEPLEALAELTGPDPRKTLDLSSAVAAAVADLPQLQQEALILFRVRRRHSGGDCADCRGRYRDREIAPASGARALAACPRGISKVGKHTCNHLITTN